MFVAVGTWWMDENLYTGKKGTKIERMRTCWKNERKRNNKSGWGNRFQFSSPIGDYFINYVVG